MGSVGDAYGNAMAESFFASLECELIISVHDPDTTARWKTGTSPEHASGIYAFLGYSFYHYLSTLRTIWHNR
jgi:hypothetical protein